MRPSIRTELSSRRVVGTDGSTGTCSLAFLDISPVSEGHTQVIPKCEWCWIYFTETASSKSVGIYRPCEDPAGYARRVFSGHWSRREEGRESHWCRAVQHSPGTHSVVLHTCSPLALTSPVLRGRTTANWLSKCVYVMKRLSVSGSLILYVWVARWPCSFPCYPKDHSQGRPRYHGR